MPPSFPLDCQASPPPSPVFTRRVENRSTMNEGEEARLWRRANSRRRINSRELRRKGDKKIARKGPMMREIFIILLVLAFVNIRTFRGKREFSQWLDSFNIV